MKYLIRGKIHDSQNNPLSKISITAYDEDPLTSDDKLGITNSVDDGTFEISFDQRQFDLLGLEGEPEVYLVISDVEGKFLSIMDKGGYYEKSVDTEGNTTWTGNAINNISDIDKYNITVVTKLTEVPENYEAVVIGSGFGGTILALTLGNKFESDNNQHNSNSRVCILERGQWWISHEMPSNADGTLDGFPTMRQFFDENNMPYGLWSYPDNTKGFLKLIGNTRIVNPVKGLYDYTAMRNVSVVTGSGVGGGSLVYFNITEKPEPSVYKNWPTQKTTSTLDTRYTYKEVYLQDAEKYVDDPAKVDDKELDYFKIAENFIGVNAITTTAGLGKFKLARTKIFQNAAVTLTGNSSASYEVINPTKPDGQLDLDARLSITDVSTGLFSLQKDSTIVPPKVTIKRPTISETNKYSQPVQSNICQRQGRCGLGCIPGARHTLNKRLVDAIHPKPTSSNPNPRPKPIDILPLCNVSSIEETNDGSEYKYNIFFIDHRDVEDGVERKIRAKYVILAAGTLGSTKILLRSKKLQLSDSIGTHFSTNGDIFGVVTPTKEIVDASRGPMQTSIVRLKNKDTKALFSIEDLGIPKMFGDVLSPVLLQMVSRKVTGSITPKTNLLDMLRVLIFNKFTDSNTTNELAKLISGLNIDSSRILTDKLANILDDIDRFIADPKIRAQSAEERLYNILLLFGVGVDGSDGHMILDKEGNLDLEKPYDLDQSIYNDLTNGMKLLSNKIGMNGEDDLAILFWDTSNKRQITAHPLGGCPMGINASEGTVNSFGQVFRGKTGDKTYDDLYVVDGSIIPNALGVNPSLTISALAFRIAEQIAMSKEFWPK